MKEKFTRDVLYQVEPQLEIEKRIAELEAEQTLDRISSDLTNRHAQEILRLKKENRNHRRLLAFRMSMMYMVTVILILAAGFIAWTRLDSKVQSAIAGRSMQQQVQQDLLPASQNDYPEIRQQDIVTKLYEDTKTQVVRIFSGAEKGTDGVLRPAGIGSGVVVGVSEEYYDIITNNHVIARSEKIDVVRSAKDAADSKDLELISAKLIGTDRDRDIALIRVSRKQLEEDAGPIAPIKFADSKNIMIGQTVLAIGSPLGEAKSITKGIISAINVDVQKYSDVGYIQTDAAINPGNSGGALINLRGELIGINTLKSVGVNLEGIGYAISIDTVKWLYDEIAQKGHVNKPYIGFRGISNPPYQKPGVRVSEIMKDSPAANSDLMVGDIIIAIDGNKIKNMDELSRLLTLKKIGDKIKIHVIRQGHIRDVELILGSYH